MSTPEQHPNEIKLEKVEQNERKLKIFVNGALKDEIPKNSAADLKWLGGEYARQEGIKNFQIKVDGKVLNTDQIAKAKADNVESIEVNTFDTAA